MKFVNSIPFGRFGPRGFCRDEGPYDPLYARGAAPREQVVRLGFCSPHLGVLRPSTPGDFAGTEVPAPPMQALRESMALPCSAPG